MYVDIRKRNWHCRIEYMFVDVETGWIGMGMQQSISAEKEKGSIKNVPNGTRKKSVTG